MLHLKLKLPLLAMRIGFLYKNADQIGLFLTIAGYSSNSFGSSYNIIRTGNPKTEELYTWDGCHAGTLDTWNFFLLDGVVYLMCPGIYCMKKFRANVPLDQNLLIFFCLKRRRRWTTESQEIGGGSFPRLISQHELCCDTNSILESYLNSPSIINKLEKITTV